MSFAPLIARRLPGTSLAALARSNYLSATPFARFASTSSTFQASASPSHLRSTSAFKSLSSSRNLQAAQIELVGTQTLATANSPSASLQTARVNQKALSQLLKGAPTTSVAGAKLNQIAYSALPGLGLIHLDAPEPYQYGFQDGGSVTMEGITELHNAVMYFVIAIVTGVTYALAAIVYRFRVSKNPIASKYLNHGTLIELIWTITPALVLVAIAFPSFRLLYLMDEVISPALTIKVMGHQWYWSYEYCDFINSEEDDE